MDDASANGGSARPFRLHRCVGKERRGYSKAMYLRASSLYASGEVWSD